MRLRSEIADLEARTLPTYENQESAELQRRLRGEINSLELYVAKLQNELSELYNERDSIKEKLRKVEGQCTIWQDKSASTEQDFDNLIEKHKQQEIELNCLRSHCNELAALLEEMRASNRSNESCVEGDGSMMGSTSNLLNSEDLACAVVEVQLRDVQKDNVELKNILKECRDNSSKLQQELVDVKERFETLEIDYNAMKVDNENLIVKVTELTETQSILFDTREELETTLKQVTELSLENSSLTENINLLHQKVSETNASLLDVESSNRLLCTEIELLHCKNNTTNQDLSKKSADYTTLQEEMELLQSNYDNLVEKYTKTDYNLQSLTLNFDKLNAEVEHNLQNLEELVFGADSKLDLNDKDKAFEMLFSTLEGNAKQELESKQLLVSRITWFEELNKKLRKDIVTLEEKEAISLQERRLLYDNLNSAENKIKLLEDTVTQHVAKIEDLNGTISEMSNTIKELEILKSIVEQKQIIIADLEQVNTSLQYKLKQCNEELAETKTTRAELQKQLDTTDRIRIDFETKIAELYEKLYIEHEDKTNLVQAIAELQALKNVFEKQVSELTDEIAKSKNNEENLLKSIYDLQVSKSSLERQITDANTKIEQQKAKEAVLENELFENEKQRQLTIQNLNLKIEDYTKQIQELELNLQSSKFTCSVAEKDMKLLQDTKVELLQQIHLCKSDFDKRIAAVEDTKKKLQDDLELSVRDALDIQGQLLMKGNQYDQVKAERDKISEEYSTMEKQLKSCKEKLSILDGSCTEKDDLLSKATQDLLVIKLETEVKSEQIAHLEQNISEGNLRVEELHEEIAHLNEKNEELRMKTTELISESKLLDDMKNSLQNKCAELESNGWKVVNELAGKNEQLEDLLSKYNKYQEMTQAKLNGLEISLSQSKADLNDLSEEKNKMESEKNNEIKNLQQKIDEMTDVIEAFKAREVEYIEQIRNIKNELGDTITQYTEALQIRQELEAENDFHITTLTENLHNIIEKYNALNVTHTNTIAQLETAQAHVTKLENTKLELEVKALQQKVQFEEDYNKCVVNFNVQIQEKADREAALQNEVKQVIRKLDTSEKNYNDLQNHVTKMCGELAQLQGEKAKLGHSLRMFKLAYQDLKNVYSSLKVSHLEFVSSNTNCLTNLKVDLLEHIDLMLTKNDSLSKTIDELHEKVNILSSEQELISVMHMEKLDNKDKEIMELSKDNEIFKENMNKMLQDKEILEQRLCVERANVSELQQAATASNAKMQECLKNITNMKCINDVLETAKLALENEILSKTDKIVELERLKCEDYNKYTEEICIRDTEIKMLSEKIATLEKQLFDNSTKNGELMIELCTVNQTLENLTKQYTTLQKALTEEKEETKYKIHHYESSLSDNQSILQNLQSENDFVTKEITVAKEKIYELKEQLKSSLMEKQTLALQIKLAHEKLEEEDLNARKHESEIADLNSKLLLKLEDILELEKEKQSMQQKLDVLSREVDSIKKNRDEIFESQDKIIKETENHLIRAHQNAIDVKDDLMKRIVQLQNENIKDKQLRTDLEKLLEGEKMAKEILEIRVLELMNEKTKFCQLMSNVKHNICVLGTSLCEKTVEIIFNADEFQELNMNDMESLNQNIELIQNKITTLLKQNTNCLRELNELQQEKSDLTCRISTLIQESTMTLQEKEKLLEEYNILYQEKIERERDLKSFNDIKLEHSMLQAKYDQAVACNKNNDVMKTKNDELIEQIRNLESKTTEIYDVYKKYAGYSSIYKVSIEKLISERAVLEKLVTNSRQIMYSIQVKLAHLNDDREKARLIEQTNSFEIILEDIQKQFLRSSRKIHEIILLAVEIPVIINDGIKSNSIPLDDNFKINFDEEYDTIVDCKDRATDLLDQMVAFDGAIGGRSLKLQKETILRSSNNTNTDTKVSDDELKKRNIVLKQRLTLAENAKSNLEKKIKQLRQENKTRAESSESIYSDASYKTLLQQHIQSKDEYEKKINDFKTLYNKLQQEFKEYKNKNKVHPEQLKYERGTKTEQEIKLERDVLKLREAYGNVISENSRLDLENATLRKLLEDRTSQLSELMLIKEAYEKLLEENNKLGMELDTLKYKRNKDRESLFEARKSAKMENRKIEEIKNEYEGKLEKMKNKMIQLYKETIDKELQKLHSDQTGKPSLLKTQQLRQNLELDQRHSDTSIVPRDSFFLNLMEPPSMKSVESEASYSRRKAIEDRKYSTLPKQMSVIKEDAVLKRNTLSSIPKHLGPDGQELEMEDEDGDLFNNKYLTDLKEGRCEITSGRESDASRISELIWRNSFCPPHLKSSYPAETQFNSPRQFKEEDIKSGAGDFNDSMSTRLLPSEKPRKKDFGTTSYKKPGPPTPSKNGGRVSLQSSELREVLQVSNESKTPPRRITPSRLRQLFLGKGNISTKENSETQYSTPRSKRLSIFRKPK